jgi:thioredoxin 1
MTDLVQEITDYNFEDEALTGSNLVMVEFFSDWSPSCKRVTDLVFEVAQKYPGRLKVRRVDIDRSTETVVRQRVLTVPSVVFYRNDGELERMSGNTITKGRLAERIEALIAQYVPQKPVRSFNGVK